MEFFDCNVFYGRDVVKKTLMAAPEISDLLGEMENAGVDYAMVGNVEQLVGGTVESNNSLSRDLAGRENLFGVWGILPSHTHEMEDGNDLISAMKKNRIYGLRLIPDIGRYMVQDFVLRDRLEMAIRANIPIFVNTGHGNTLNDMAMLMKAFPRLTVVFTHANVWPNDRYLRPFVKEFKNFYLDISYMITERGIESFVARYTADRLLFGSGFPLAYFGANMMMVKHSNISEEEKKAIASGNMKRIIGEVIL